MVPIISQKKNSVLLRSEGCRLRGWGRGGPPLVDIAVGGVLAVGKEKKQGGRSKV